MSLLSPHSKIFSAVRNGHEEILMRYIASGGDLNITDHDGWSLLMHAAVHGQTKMVQILLGYGASPDIADEQNNTAHAIAMKRGYTEIALWIQQASEAS